MKFMNEMTFVRILIYLVCICLFLVVYVRIFEKTSIFLPSRDMLADPSLDGLVYDDVFFDTPDGARLNAWLVKKSAASPTLIFLHGNAGNISYRMEKIKIFHDLGLNVFIIDYRGYGKSKGRPSEKAMYTDSLAAYDYLLARSDIDRNNLVIYGESLGGAAATLLATQRQARALVLDSTFTTAKDMAKVIMPFVPGFLISSKLDSLTKVQHISIPKLFIHSREDEIVPYVLAQKLFKAAVEPKEFLEIEGDHNEGFVLSWDVYTGGLRQFLRKNTIIVQE